MSADSGLVCGKSCAILVLNSVLRSFFLFAKDTFLEGLNVIRSMSVKNVFVNT